MAIAAYQFNNPFNPSSNGGYGDGLVSYLQARYGFSTKNGAVFSYNRTAVTVPVVAVTMVSVFFLYNPVASGKNLFVLNACIGQVLAATVVNTYGFYTGTTVEIAAGTFTTPATPLSRIVNGVAGVGVPYSAYTHSGTPTRRAIIGSHGATTNANSSMIDKWFDGDVMIPPGTGLSIAATTAAGTASGLDPEVTWMELPV